MASPYISPLILPQAFKLEVQKKCNGQKEIMTVIRSADTDLSGGAECVNSEDTDLGVFS